jgi:hypothetical protein
LRHVSATEWTAEDTIVSDIEVAIPILHSAFEETLVKIPATIVGLLLFASFTLAQTQTPNSPKTAPPAPSQAGPEPGSATPAGAPAIDPAKEADIRRLLEVAGTQSMMTQVMNNLAKNMKPMLANSLPPGDYRDKLIDLFLEKFMARANVEFPKLADAAIPIYDKYLSDEDIKGLIQYYQTPLGRKTLSVLPMIIAEMQSQGQKLGERIGRESMLQVLADHPELAKEMEEARSAPAH